MALPRRVQQDPQLRALDQLTGAFPPHKGGSIDGLAMQAMEQKMIEEIVNREQAKREDDINMAVEQALPQFLMSQGKGNLLSDDEIQGLLDREAAKEQNIQETDALRGAYDRFGGAAQGYEHDIYRNPNDPSYRPGQVMSRRKEKELPPVDYERAAQAMEEAKRITAEAKAERLRQQLPTPSPEKPQAPAVGESVELTNPQKNQPGEYRGAPKAAPAPDMDHPTMEEMVEGQKQIDANKFPPTPLKPEEDEEVQAGKPKAKKPEAKKRSAPKPGLGNPIDWASMFNNVGRIRGLNDAAMMARAQNRVPAIVGLGGVVANPMVPVQVPVKQKSLWHQGLDALGGYGAK